MLIQQERPVQDVPLSSRATSFLFQHYNFYNAMKAAIMVLTLVCSIQTGFAQISALRYNDNFAYLKNDTIARKDTEKLKYIRLSKENYLSIGGEIRTQFQYHNNQNFGDVPPSFSSASTTQLWQRLLLHANLELGKNVRLFTQLNSTYRFLNPNPAAAEIDENHLSLHQAFIDCRFNNKWQLRLGRQELAYGSHRLITFREGPNTRLTFDGFILKYQSPKRKIDFLAITLVVSRPGVFDDKSFEDYVWGMYGTEQIVPDRLMLDYYSLSFTSDKRRYNYQAGKERRESYGLRLYSRNPVFNYDFESTFQTGKFNDNKIWAYSLAADINLKLNKRAGLVTGLGANYVTGDKNRTDNQLNTYNLLFSKPQFGLTAPIGATNMINMNPYIAASPAKNVGLNLNLYCMWRQSKNDGIYSPLAVETRPKPALIEASDHKEIGQLLALETSFEVCNHLSVYLDACHFFAGKYVKETGAGKDINYLSLKVQLKF